MALNLGMTKEHWDASERVRQAISQQRKMSQDEAISQANSRWVQNDPGRNETE